MKAQDRVEIRVASRNEMKDFLGGIQLHQVIDVFGAFVNGVPVGLAGVLRDPVYFGTIFEEEGRLIGFLDASEELRAVGAKVVRAAKTYLKSQKKEIFVMCDNHNYPDAGRLLNVIGFVETDGTETNSINHKKMRVWVWRP